MSGSNCTDLDHCECVDALYQRIAELEGAIEFAFNNASNSFIGINFSFEAVKKLREAQVAEKALPDAKLQEKDDE